MSIFDSKNHKQRVFEAFAKQHIVKVYQTAYRLTGNQSDAEDLVQELLLKLYQMPQDFTAIEAPRAWLNRILTNLYIDNYRRKSRSPELSDSSDLVLAVMESGYGIPEEEAQTENQRRELQRVLGKLDPEQKSLVVLHMVEGNTLEQLTEVFRVPVGTLKSRLHRTKAQLRSWLEMEPF